jgi:hypothetical protein
MASQTQVDSELERMKSELGSGGAAPKEIEDGGAAAAPAEPAPAEESKSQ